VELLDAIPAYKAPRGGRLDDAMLADYRAAGVLVLEDFVPVEACERLRERALRLVDAFDPQTVRHVFSTTKQTQLDDRYFIESGDKIRFFLEDDAFDEAGRLRQPKEQSLNKIGHAMHDLDPVFDAFSRTPELAGVARSVGLRDPVILQSMYIFKPPRIGGEVVCHQDSTYIYTEPESCVGFWFALEDATLENGCLWAAPGGHRTGLRQLFKRTGDMTDRDGTTIETLDPTPLPSPPDDLVPLEVPAGTLVVLNGLLPHWSDANRSGRSRHAYTLHCISAGAEYPEWNWLRRPDELPLRRLDTVAA